MPKAMTKSQIAANLAERVGITRKQALQTLEVVAELAYKQARNSFTLPGIGKLVLTNRPARRMTMQFGAKKGQTVSIPAKRIVKFRVAKAVKDALLGASGGIPSEPGGAAAPAPAAPDAPAAPAAAADEGDGTTPP